jgi:hypothetical protein
VLDAQARRSGTMLGQLLRLPGLTVYPSAANFLLAGDGRQGRGGGIRELRRGRAGRISQRPPLMDCLPRSTPEALLRNARSAEMRTVRERNTKDAVRVKLNLDSKGSQACHGHSFPRAHARPGCAPRHARSRGGGQGDLHIDATTR